MNGAESLIRTLIASGVEVCFANAGTSEMHFVLALDKIEGMRCILGMAETVVTGCADGYARMAERPAMTLLHCGPGFANGIANLHNARRANTPMVNIVGDQASYHRPFDPPLAADTEGLARAVSHWVRTSGSAKEASLDGAAAVQAARTPPGQIATLIVPADVAWSEGGAPAAPLPVPARPAVAPDADPEGGADSPCREQVMLLLSGPALGEAGLFAAYRIAHASGAKLRTPTQVPRMARGRGSVPVERVPYVVDTALKCVIRAQTRHPRRRKASSRVLRLSGQAQPDDASGLRDDGARAAGAGCDGRPPGTCGRDRRARVVPIEETGPKPHLVSGPFESEAFGLTLAALLPENAIVVDDSVTSGRSLFPATFNAAPHDWFQRTGGAIGHAFPCATGAAVACPDRKVVCLQADGAGMYSLQALWTQAREKLDVVNIVFANRVYKILYGELRSTGAEPGRASDTLFDLGRPDLDWVGLAKSMGVEAVSVETLEGFADTFRAACGRRGPFLIEFRIL